MRHTTAGEDGVERGVRTPPRGPRGLLAALAAALGPTAIRPRQRLAHLALGLGLERLEWWPDGTGEPLGSSGRPREREVDRAWLEAIPAASTRTIRPGGSRRRPRLAGGSVGETWVRTSAGARPAGWLRLVGAPAADLGAGDLVGLADLVSVHLATGGDPGPAPEGRASHQWSALVHDLRNELTFAQLALERAHLEGLAPTREILATLARAREFCGDALRRSPSAGPPRAVALHEVLRAEARAAGESGRGPGGVSLCVRCATDVIAAAEPIQLRRVLRNLLLNALEASTSGGRVALSADRDGARVRVLVEDDGRGMSAEDMRTLFAPGTTGGAGTGWGTASILAGVAALGGALSIESGPGEGTRVQLDLWAAPAPDRPSVARVDARFERAARRALELETQGFGVWVVPRAEQARELLALDPRLRRVELAAGGDPAGWRALRAECAARGVAFETRSINRTS